MAESGRIGLMWKSKIHVLQPTDGGSPHHPCVPSLFGGLQGWVCDSRHVEGLERYTKFVELEEQAPCRYVDERQTREEERVDPCKSRSSRKCNALCVENESTDNMSAPSKSTAVGVEKPGTRHRPLPRTQVVEL